MNAQNALSIITPPCIRVLIANNSPDALVTLERYCLAFDDVCMVGMAHSSEETVHLAGNLAPEIVVIDLHGQMMDGLLACHLIRWKYPDIQVILLAGNPEWTWMRLVYESGPFSVVSPAHPDSSLIDHIRTASQAHYRQTLHPDEMIHPLATVPSLADLIAKYDALFVESRALWEQSQELLDCHQRLHEGKS